MAREWVTDELWAEARPLLPMRPLRPKGGRPPADDPKCLVGILFVLRTGCAWENIPAEMAPSGTTCWRRMQEWTQAGVWPRLHKVLLRRLGKQGRLEFSRAVADSASFRAVFGGRTPAPTRRTGARTDASVT
jgi:transposase